MMVGNKRRRWWLDVISSRTISYRYTYGVRRPNSWEGECYLSLGQVGDLDVYWGSDGVRMVRRSFGPGGHHSDVPSYDMRADR